MNKDWRTILRFAIVGLSIATVFFTLFESKLLVDNSTPVWTHGAALILCPGFIPFAWWMAAGELAVQNVELMWLIIGLINYLLYGALGAVYVRFRNWGAETARI
jgi:hypothetical protein